MRSNRLHHVWWLLIFGGYVSHITVVQLLISLAALALAFVACCRLDCICLDRMRLEKALRMGLSFFFWKQKAPEPWDGTGAFVWCSARLRCELFWSFFRPFFLYSAWWQAIGFAVLWRYKTLCSILEDVIKDLTYPLTAIWSLLNIDDTRTIS